MHQPTPLPYPQVFMDCPLYQTNPNNKQTNAFNYLHVRSLYRMSTLSKGVALNYFSSRCWLFLDTKCQLIGYACSIPFKKLLLLFVFLVRFILFCFCFILFCIVLFLFIKALKASSRNLAKFWCSVCQSAPEADPIWLSGGTVWQAFEYYVPERQRMIFLFTSRFRVK